MSADALGEMIASWRRLSREMKAFEVVLDRVYDSMSDGNCLPLMDAVAILHGEVAACGHTDRCLRAILWGMNESIVAAVGKAISVYAIGNYPTITWFKYDREPIGVDLYNRADLVVKVFGNLSDMRLEITKNKCGRLFTLRANAFKKRHPAQEE